MPDTADGELVDDGAAPRLDPSPPLPPGVDTADGAEPGIDALAARASADLVAVIDQATDIIWVNDRSADVTGFEPHELVGTSALDLLHPDDVELAATVLAGSALARPELRPARYRLRHARDGWVDVEASGGSMTLPDGSPAVVVTCRPSNRRVIDVLTSLASGRDMDHTIDDILDTFLSSRTGTASVITWHDEGGRHASTHDHAPVGLLAEGTSGETPETVAREGETVRVTDLISIDRGVTQAARSAGFTGFVTLAVDDPGGFPPATVTQWAADPRILDLLALGAIAEPAWTLRLALQLREYRRQLEQAARTDPLTGVANRAGLFDHLEGPCSGGSDAEPVTLLYVDLDGFKPVNDDHGHATGDQVLVATAARLRHAVRPSDLVARVGGDEFVVVCPGTPLDDAALVADRLLEAIAEPVEAGGRSVTVTASIGVATTTREALAADELLRSADAAMYTAKRAGKGRWAPASTAS